MAKCTVGSCNQQACVASQEERLCGTHWRLALERRETADEKEDLLNKVRQADTVDDLAPVLEALIEKAFG